MSQHFEDLWEESEKLLQAETNITSISEMIQETIGKIALYGTIDAVENMPDEDKQRLKSHALGKVVLLLTQLSSKDNINVYAALKAALDDTKIGIFESKYK